MKNIRVALYVRVSTQEQAKEGYSIGEQTERLELYCEAMCWTVVNVYTDPGYSGAKLERPGLKEMIQDIKSGKIDKVVVYKLDRLSRSQKDTLYLIEDIFLKNSTDFVSMSENFDTATPFGRAMIGILAVFAQLEREQIKERLTMGREGRAKKGLYTGNGAILIGYDYNKVTGELTINEYGKMLVNEVFRLFNEGTPKKTIASKMNNQGLIHQYGEWNDLTIGRILKNRHYIGEVKFDNKWYPGNHEPIIDLSTFEKAQTLLRKQRASWSGTNKASTPLGGFIYCSRCGAKYQLIKWKPKVDGTKTEQYICNSRSKKQAKLIKDPNCKNDKYNVKDLEDIIFGEIRKLKLDPNYIQEIRLSDTGQNDKAKIEIIRKEIHDLSEQISSYMDLYAIKKLSLTDVDAKIDPLIDRRSALEFELDNLMNDLDNTDVISDDEILDLASVFDDTLKNGILEDVRSIIASLIDKIEIDGKDVTIYWTFA
jgi:site-specific DNA recombinase